MELTDATFVSVQAQKNGHEVIEHNYNQSQWFSFYQRQNGVIRLVRLFKYLRKSSIHGERDDMVPSLTEYCPEEFGLFRIF